MTEIDHGLSAIGPMPPSLKRASKALPSIHPSHIFSVQPLFLILCLFPLLAVVPSSSRFSFVSSLSLNPSRALCGMVGVPSLVCVCVCVVLLRAVSQLIH